MDDNFFKDNLKDQLNDFEATPADNAWDGIKKQFDHEQRIHRYERRSAIVVLLLLLVATSFFLTQSQGEPQVSHVIQKPIEIANDTNERPKDIASSVERSQGKEKKSVDHSVSNIVDAEPKVSSGNVVANQGHNNGIVQKDAKSQQSHPIIEKLAPNHVASVAIKALEQQPLIRKATAQSGKKGSDDHFNALEKIGPESNLILGFKDPELSVNKVPVVEDRSAKKYRLKLFALATPGLMYNQLNTNKNDDVIISMVEEQSAITTERVGYTSTIGASMFVSNKIEISSGISYAWSNESFDYVETSISSYEVDVSDLDDAYFALKPVFTQRNKAFSLNRKALGLHMGVALLLAPGKQIQQFVGGNVALQKNLIREVSGGENEPQFDLHRFFGQAGVFYRLQYRVNRHFDLLFQPTYSYSTSINKSTEGPLSIKPNNFSISLGLSYQL